MPPAASGCIPTWSANEPAGGNHAPILDEPAVGRRSPVAQHRCRGDAFDLPPPYPARDRGERGRQRHTGAGGFARPTQEPAQSPLAALVATCGGEVVGYAYVVLFRKRPAYRYAVKHSIYVHHEHLGHGVGRLLMQELIDACAAAGFRQMIGYIDSDNAASLAIHEKFGFRRVGLLPGVAFRYGRWADTVMVQRSLAAGSTEPPLTSNLGR
jgi:L-amino acid N-acyltransferase YncA